MQEFVEHMQNNKDISNLSILIKDSIKIIKFEQKIKAQKESLRFELTIRTNNFNLHLHKEHEIQELLDLFPYLPILFCYLRFIIRDF